MPPLTWMGCHGYDNTTIQYTYEVSTTLTDLRGSGTDMVSNQAWGQVHEYMYLSTFKYTFDSTCTLLKYFLISAGVLVLIP